MKWKCAILGLRSRSSRASCPTIPARPAVDEVHLSEADTFGKSRKRRTSSVGGVEKQRALCQPQRPS